MSILRSPWLILVELPIPANATMRANFPDQPDLTTLLDQEIKILGIEVFTDEIMATAPSGNTVAPLAEYQKAMLTLINEDVKRVYQWPMLALNRIYGNPATGQPHIQDLQLVERLSNIAWTKSGVEFSAAPSNPPYSFLLGIHYDKLEGEAVKKY